MVRSFFSINSQRSKTWPERFFLSWFNNLNVVGWLIIVNIVVFITTLFNFDFSIKYFALQANNLFLHNYWWTLLTSMFMHANFLHLFVNILSLYFIGNFLEIIIGKKRFFWLYIFSGIFAGLFFASFSFLFSNYEWAARLFGAAGVSALGASGAIFGIAGVLALLTPKNKVYLIAGPIFAIILESILRIVVKSSAFFSIFDFFFYAYFFLCIYSIFSFNPSMRKISIPIQMPFWFIPIAAIVPLIIIGFFIPLPIGNMAHLGGLIAGLLYGLYLRIKYKKKTKIICEYFSK
jgi:membrane associated rhomboid family serine protease